MKSSRLCARAATAFLAGVLAAFCILGPTDSLAQSGRLLQISTRAQILGGDDVMIAGFVIGGGASKTVAIVATGPSLGAFGIQNWLANPTVTLVRMSDQATLATTDDWQSAGNAPQLQAAGLAPSHPLESAILTSLAPGAYTAIVRGAGATTGVGVVGVYELDHPELPLVNISTRARVSTGENVVIAGFAVGPADPTDVVVSLTGPSLAAFGIQNPLANPALSLVRMSDQAVVASNDDWQVQANPADVAALQANGLQPSHPLEAAIIATLQPGLYTAIASGVGGGTGTAVVAVYKVNRHVEITSGNTTTFRVGTAGTFTITTAGFPAASSVTLTGALPAGVTFTPGSTTATLSGTPANGTGGTYPLTITASNGTPPNATQAFTLVVNQAPAITSVATATFHVGSPGTHNVLATGFPTPTLAMTGALPAGVAFNPATGLLSGTPAAGTTGTYPLTFTAANGTLPNASQGFTLTVAAGNSAPVLAGIEAAALAYTENGASVAISATLAVTDPDSTNLAGATVQITGNCAAGQDVLAFTNQNGISGAYTAATCLMTLTGSATLANYQTAIRSVRYSNSSQNPSTLARVLSIRANDGAPVNNLSNIATRGIAVTAVNDAPTATAFAGLPAQAGIPITYPVAKLGGTDPDGTAVSVDTTPTNVTNGTVTLNANGSFTFTPSPSAATASFQYRVTDTGSPLPALGSPYVTVSFTVSGPPIYFVKNPAVGLANCTLGNECTFAQAIAAIGANANATIFIGDANSHTAGSILNSGARVIGQGVTGTTFDALFGIGAPAQGTLAARPAINQARPTITAAAGTTLTVGPNNTLRGFNLGNASAAGIGLSGNAFGTLTMNDALVNTAGQALALTNGTFNAVLGGITSAGGTNNVSFNTVAGGSNLGTGALSGASGNAFNVTAGTASITYGGTIASGTGRSVSVANKTGGTIALTGAITDTDTGILLANNTGATIAFTGPLALSTGANAAFTATGGGTVAATSASNSITTTTGTALNVSNTTIGPSGLNFVSISSNGGTGNGIVLDNTGAAGGLTVTGDGTNTAVGGNGTGGTIANKSGTDLNFTNGIGIYLNNTKNVVLRRMIINGANQNFGIRGTRGAGFPREYSTVTGTNGTAASRAAPENAGEGGIYFGNVTTNGVATQATFTKNVIGGGRARNLSIINTAGTLALTIKGNTFQLNQNFADANQSLLVEARGGTVNAILGGTLAGEPNSFAGAPGDNVNFTGQAGSAMTVTMRNNTLANSHLQNVIGGGGLTLATQGTMNFVVDGNSINGADGSAVTLFKASAATLMSGIFNNNTIGTSGLLNSGSKSGNGIFVSAAGAGTMSYTLTNNTIRQYKGNAGIFADNTGGSYTANFTITGNTTAEPGATSFAGLAITNGSPGSADTVQVCANIKNNDFSAGDPANANDIIVGASGAAAGHTFVLPGLATFTQAGVETFIKNNNVLPASTAVSAYTDAPVTFSAFTGTGTTCPTP